VVAVRNELSAILQSAVLNDVMKARRRQLRNEACEMRRFQNAREALARVLSGPKPEKVTGRARAIALHPTGTCAA